MPGISKFSYIKTYRYRLHFDTWFLIFFNFSWVFKGCFNKNGTVLMMSAKMATTGLLKIKVFWNISYDVIISVIDVTNKILLHDSNHIVDVVMWPKFGHEILQQCGKIVKTKSQEALWADSYVCKNYRVKTDRGPFYLAPSWIGLKHWIQILNNQLNIYILTFFRNGVT